MAASSNEPFVSVKGTKIPFPQPVIEAVTQAQYDALTDDQKAKGVYFVSDDVIPAAP